MQKPQSYALPSVEKSLLGGLVRDKQARKTVFELIPSHTYFADFAHQQIYKAIRDICADGLEPELVLLAQRLHKTDFINEIGGPDYLADIYLDATVLGHDELARQIVQAHVRRQTIEQLRQIEKDISDKARPPYQVLIEAGKTFAALTLPLLTEREEGETISMSYTPFPLDALPSFLGEYIQATSESLPVDPGMLVIPSLVTFGACIGANRCVALNEGWYEQPIFWGCVIASPSSKKTAACRKITFPLWQIESAFEKPNQDAFNKAELLLREWQSQGASLKGKEALDHIESMPEDAISRSFVVDDITLESLYRELHDNPRGLICLQNELRSWLKSMARYTNSGTSGEEAKWLEFFDGGEGKITRKSAGKKPIRVANKHVSLFGTIQPATLANCIRQDQFDSGLMARFLWAYPPDVVGELSHKHVSQEWQDEFSGLCKTIFDDDAAEQKGRMYKPKIVNFTSAGQKAWESWYNDWQKHLATSSGELSYTLKRLEAYCGKIALVLACIEKHWAKGRALQIHEAHVKNAIRITHWFENEAIRVFRMMKGKPSERKRESLFALVKSHGGQCTARQLMRSNPSGYPDVKAAEEALDVLAKEGKGTWQRRQSSDQGGRPSRVLVLH